MYSSHVMFLFCFVLFGVGAQSMKFPNDFKFGVATASYQTEGAWNEGGKGENIWDRLTHFHPDWIADKSNGDVACDSYHRVSEDVRLLKDLGVQFYRFSLSWSRLLPTGFANVVNADGVRYYNGLVDELLRNGIEPMVTLYHWDLPQPLQEIGGMPNEALVDAFAEYARFAFRTFGDRVRTWITFNEPQEVCQAGYGDGDNAPAYNSDGVGTYMCGRTLLLSHAAAYRLYDQEFRAGQKGKIGITISVNWFEPYTQSQEDIEASEICIQMMLGWYAHPIFSKDGDYPAVMKERINRNSREEGFRRSRLEPLTPEQIARIRGTYDFFGLNHYTSWMVNSKNKTTGASRPSYRNDVGFYVYKNASWPESAAPWLRVVPWGFRKILNWIKNEYGNPELYVTENGYADKGQLDDSDRINYLELYLEAMLKAIYLDGCNVRGYTVWSLLDNFEWRQGYTQRFGLYRVDFDSANRTRTAKSSVEFYKNIIKERSLSLGPEVRVN